MTEFQHKRINAIRESINNEWSEKYMRFIEKHPEKPWNWDGISSNPNVTIEMIEKHPEKPWDWSNISSNPIVTMEMIEKHSEKPWDWNSISWNPLKKDREEFQYKKYREHMSAYKNQQWYKASLCPEYKLCKKRVNEFYDRVIKTQNEIE